MRAPHSGRQLVGCTQQFAEALDLVAGEVQCASDIATLQMNFGIFEVRDVSTSCFRGFFFSLLRCDAITDDDGDLYD